MPRRRRGRRRRGTSPPRGGTGCRACARTGCRWLARIEVPRLERPVEHRERLLEQRHGAVVAAVELPVRRRPEAEHAWIGVPSRPVRPPRRAGRSRRATGSRSPPARDRRTTSRARAPATWRPCRARGSPRCARQICSASSTARAGSASAAAGSASTASSTRGRGDGFSASCQSIALRSMRPGACSSSIAIPNPNSGCEPNSTTRPSPQAPATMFATSASTASSSRARSGRLPSISSQAVKRPVRPATRASASAPSNNGPL